VCRSGVLLDQPSRSEDQTRSIRKDSAVHASLSRLHLSKSRIAKRCTPRKTSDAARCPRPSHSLVSGSIRCPTPQRQHRDEPDLGPPNLRVNTARNQNSEPADTPNRHKTIPPSSRQARMPKCPKNQPTKHRNSGAVDGGYLGSAPCPVNTRFSLPAFPLEQRIIPYVTSARVRGSCPHLGAAVAFASRLSPVTE
jgi:hypothetical protein